MYNEIRESMRASRYDLDELYKHMDLTADPEHDTRWTMLMFAVRWFQDDPVPVEVIRYIDRLWERGKIKL